MKNFKMPGNLPKLEDIEGIQEKCWSNMEANNFNVRSGTNYENNGEKSPSLTPFYNVKAVDCFKTKKSPLEIGKHVDFSHLNNIKNGGNSENLIDPNFLKNATETKEKTQTISSPLVKTHSLLKPLSSSLKTHHNSHSFSKNVSKSNSEKVISKTTQFLEKEPTELPQWFIVTIIVPGPQKTVLSSKRKSGNLLVIYAQRNESIISQAEKDKNPALHLMKHFVSGTTPETSPQRDIRKRFKVIGKALNLDQVALPTFVGGLLNKYNGKPFLARTSTSFYSGKDYFEVVIDINRFSYLSLLGLSGVRSFLPKIKFGYGFVIQAEEDEEMPEQLVMCLELIKLDLKEMTLL